MLCFYRFLFCSSSHHPSLIYPCIPSSRCVLSSVDLYLPKQEERYTFNSLQYLHRQKMLIKHAVHRDNHTSPRYLISKTYDYYFTVPLKTQKACSALSFISTCCLCVCKVSMFCSLNMLAVSTTPSLF